MALSTAPETVLVLVSVSMLASHAASISCTVIHTLLDTPSHCMKLQLPGAAEE